MDETKIKPPKGLSKTSAQFYLRTVKEFRLKTGAELETLELACRALDRAEQCAAVLKRDGLFVQGNRGLVSHPAARLEQSSRAQYLSACRLLGIANPTAGDRSNA